MQCVAFLRNVNQGQRGHPATADILTSFVHAGAEDVRTFQSNGTVVFLADDAEAVLQAALQESAERSGVARDGFWMPLAEVAALVDAHASRPDVRRCELTVHGGGVLDRADDEVVRTADHRRCQIVDAGPGWIVTVNERDAESNSTPVAERLTGGPATSRGLPTLVRLVDAVERRG